MGRGLFVTFEGPEGAGKTTQIKELSKWFDKRGIKYLLTKEPGSPHIKECLEIRKLLLDPNNKINDKAELLLFLADRALHIDLIEKNLSEDIHVLCDRYIDSTRIYQQVARKAISRDKLDIFLDFVIGDILPDITFVFDVSTEIGLQRAKSKKTFQGGDRIEQAELSFHEDVRYGFLKLAESISEKRFVVLNTDPPKTIEQVHEEVVKIISKKLWFDGLLEERNE